MDRTGAAPQEIERARAAGQTDSYSAPADWVQARLTGGGTAGNERLTAATGVLLIVMLAALGVTILRIGPLLAPHMFIGMLLIPPVLLKMASTGYRFVRYYTNAPAYRRKGPPLAAMRILAPGVVLTTVVVFATGVALLLVGPSSRGSLLGIHKVSFVAWLALTALHVLGHLPGLGAALGVAGERGGSADLVRVGGGRGRALALTCAVAAGVVLALLYVPEFSPWLHARFQDH